MNVQSLLIQTEAWAQEELAAQTRMGKLLELQLAAVESSDTKALIEAADSIEAELGRRPARELRRTKLMGEFARAFGVSKQTLTLSSISERAKGLGIATDRIDAARANVREAVARSMRLGRKLSVQARYHQGLFREVLAAIAEGSEQPPDEERGAWVHVEA